MATVNSLLATIDSAEEVSHRVRTWTDGGYEYHGAWLHFGDLALAMPLSDEATVAVCDKLAEAVQEIRADALRRLAEVAA